MSSYKVRKAVIPAAGLGTRFLPITKTIPKELLPIIDRPLIEFTINEARDAGIEEICLVSGRGKDAIIDYFDPCENLQRHLKEKKKYDLAQTVRESGLSEGQLCAVRQLQPLGLGHAIWCARSFIESEPFAVLLPDDLILGEKGCLTELLEVYNEYGGNVLAVKGVQKSQVNKYGIVEYSEREGSIYKATNLIEKPSPQETHSSLAIIGRYVLNASVMKHLGLKKTGSGGEIQLTDAMKLMLKEEEFRGFSFSGRHFDCGCKSEYLLAQIEAGLKDPSMKPAIQDYINHC
ncbi:NTP transferase domain-containing protein [Aristophania vespae]|uniref:UTP--glucose-1-phosphate uridylyltransferase n=1 Tax=Aristophania vespae TaxID=2697033 RepID=A0A6P1NCD8_9PROT|nr:UTP--glucose-1-phosphate uridylyltransferase [Aristophania vespae]QHI95198.1 NTP transferase domain-containing protein [Aristophania vespae]UMM64425.1 UTP--glucose-1-phosphate uridylyltransferase [Aristophania vespae]